MIKNGSGFLLIELLVALAILSVSLTVITVQLWQTIRWQQESRLRMHALNVAISTLEKSIQEKRFSHNFLGEREGCTVTVRREDVEINQEKIDAMVPKKIKKMLGDVGGGSDQERFQPISVVVGWNDVSGQKKELHLLTGTLLS